MGSRYRRSLIAVAMLLTATLAAPLAAAPGARDTGPAERPRDTGPLVAEAVEVAREHLRSTAAQHGVARADVDDLRVTAAYTSAHNGVTHVYLRQVADGLDVIGAEATVNVRDGEVLHSGTRLVPGVAGAVRSAPRLDAAQAVAAAARALDLPAPRGLRTLEASARGARETLLSDGGVALSPIPAKLVFQPVDGALRLAWAVEIEVPSGVHWWAARIDAATGDLLAVDDYVDAESAEHTALAVARPTAGAAAAVTGTATGTSADESTAVEAGELKGSAGATDGASYRVYPWPLESPNDGERDVVVDPAFPDASPFGWHDTDGQPGHEHTTTRGNNVHAYTDTINTSSPDPLPEPEGGASLAFDDPIDFSQPPPTWREAATTNLFYWNNLIHDVYYRYGFDEVAGNFQVNNYGRGGRGGDDVRAEAQDGSGVNNANFATPADGSRPRMQMFLWADPARTRQQLLGSIIDGDLDAGVIIHEYGHGISNRLTGGPDVVNCLGNQEQMGEGWSDWLAIAMLTRPGDSGEEPRGMGTYVLGQPDRQAKGIRPTAYSTDMGVNPATYDTIRTAAVPHGVGYVWATMLWDVYWALVEDHGFNPDVSDDWSTGGNNLAIQLVMDGMKFQVCRPGFVDGRDAIIAADQALTGGANTCTLWRAFARRGLGVSADQGDTNNRADGTSAFDLPAGC